MTEIEAKAKAAEEAKKKAEKEAKAAEEAKKKAEKEAKAAEEKAKAAAEPKVKRPTKLAQPVPLGVGTVNDHEERLVAIENKLGL